MFYLSSSEEHPNRVHLGCHFSYSPECWSQSGTPGPKPSSRICRPSAYGPGFMRAGPAGEEQCTPRFMVPVSPQCPQVIGVPTLLHLVFQGTAISSEHTSQFILPGNTAELGCSPPLQATLEASFRWLVPLAGGSWGLLWGQSITNIGSSPWNGHCKRCRPLLAAEIFWSLRLLELRWDSLWVVGPRWASSQNPSMWNVTGLLSVLESRFVLRPLFLEPNHFTNSEIVWGLHSPELRWRSFVSCSGTSSQDI